MIITQMASEKQYITTFKEILQKYYIYVFFMLQYGLNH